MPHVRLDDRIAHHVKVMAAGTDAFALWVGMIAFANKSATDGIIPKEYLTTYWPTLQGRALHRAVDRLVAVGLLVDAEKHYLLHDYEDHQPHAMRSAQRIHKEGNKNRNREYRAREKAKNQMVLDLQEGHRDGVRDAVTHGVTDAARAASVTPSQMDTIPNHTKPLILRERENALAEAGTPSDSGPSGPEPSGEQGEREAHGSPVEAPEGARAPRSTAEGAAAPPAGGQGPRTTDGGSVGPAGSGPLTDSGGLELDGRVPSERELAFEAVGVLEPDGIPARGHPDYTAMVQVHKLICDGFRGRWEPRLALLWPGPKGKPALSEAFWVVRMVQKDPSLTHEGMVETMLDEWFDGPDPWPRNHRYPWNTFVNQMADAYVRAIDRARTREAEANEYRNDFGDLDDAAVH